MTTTIINIKTTKMDETRKVLSSREEESYLITPEPGKIIRHKPSGRRYSLGICVTQKRKLADYEEIDDPKALI